MQGGAVGRRSMVSAIAVMMVCGAAGAAPQVRPYADERAAIAACAARPDVAIEQCAGIFAAPCLARPGGETTAGAIACFSAAGAVWDDLLTDTLAAVAAAQVGQAQRRALDTAQSRWRAWREAECAYAAARFAGGSLAGVARAGCLHDETARRTLKLMRSANDAD